MMRRSAVPFRWALAVSLLCGGRSAFPEAKFAIDPKTAIKPTAEAELPAFGYFAADKGAFVFKGMKGYATFLVADDKPGLLVHSHGMSYVGESADRRFWVYRIDGFEEYAAFAKEREKGDKGYRVYYIDPETTLMTRQAERYGRVHAGFAHDH